jgi:hypothetical protein
LFTPESRSPWPGIRKAQHGRIGNLYSSEEDARSGCVLLGYDWTISRASKFGQTKVTVGHLTVPEPLQKNPAETSGLGHFDTFQKAFRQIKADALHSFVLASPTSYSKTSWFWNDQEGGAKQRGSLILSINSPEAFWNPSLVPGGRHPEAGDSTTPAGHFPLTASREDSVSAPACGSRSGRIINVRVARDSTGILVAIQIVSSNGR